MVAGRAHAIFDSLLSKNRVVLDYGCGSGRFLQEAGQRIGEGIGVDLDGRLVETANSTSMFGHVRYVQGDAKTRLPFESDRFDVIFAFDVIEHLGDEAPYIQEFYRLLRPGGRLVIEVPSRGPFRAFDIGNIKYNFPRLHRWFYYYVARQPEYYEKNFGPDAPMFGQFTRDAGEHKHYSVVDLEKIAAPRFQLERHILFGFFFELIQFVEVIACKPFGRSGSKLFSWLMEQDSRLLSPIGRAYFLGVFKKVDC
ncbi:MAG: class I SAM-dependent methyltransferase [Bryobacteraceae bacterium]